MFQEATAKELKEARMDEDMVTIMREDEDCLSATEVLWVCAFSATS